jgi:CheY-like chemotaxis protein
MILMSGLSTSEQRDRAASLGVRHFLSKPFVAEVFLKTLREVLFRHP